MKETFNPVLLKSQERKNFYQRIPSPEDVRGKYWLLGMGAVTGTLIGLWFLARKMDLKPPPKIDVTQIGRHPDPRFPVSSL